MMKVWIVMCKDEIPGTYGDTMTCEYSGIYHMNFIYAKRELEEARNMSLLDAWLVEYELTGGVIVDV